MRGPVCPRGWDSPAAHSEALPAEMGVLMHSDSISQSLPINNGIGSEVRACRGASHVWLLRIVGLYILNSTAEGGDREVTQVWSEWGGGGTGTNIPPPTKPLFKHH